MDTSFFGCMGERNCDRRISHRFQYHAPQKIFHVQGSSQSAEGTNFPRMYRKTGAVRSNQASTNYREILRFLLKPFYSAKEGWVGQTSARSQGSQQVHPIGEVQDGNIEISHSGDGTGATVDVPGYKRCIPSCPDMAAPSSLFTFCLQEQALPICGTSIRSVVRPQSLYEVDGSNSGHFKATGDFSDTLSGRSPSKSQFSVEGQGGPEQGGAITPEIRMDCQLVQVQHGAQSQNDVSRPGVRHDKTNCELTHRQADQNQRSSPLLNHQPKHNDTQSNASVGDNGISYRGSSICANTPATSSSQYPSNMERGISFSTSVAVTADKDGTSMVVEPQEPSPRSIMGNSGMGGDIHGCQPPGMGGDMGQAVGTRSMVSGGSQTTNKHSGTESSEAGPNSMGRSSQSMPNTHSKRQRDNSGVHKSSGRNKKSGRADGSQTDSALGRNQFSKVVCDTYSGSVQHKSGLSQSESAGPRGMGATSRDIPRACRSMGDSQHRSNGIKRQSKSNKIFRPLQRSISSGGGCHDTELAVQPRICLSAASHAAKGSEEDQAISVNSNNSGPILASENLVHRPAGDVRSATNSAKMQARPASAGSHSSPQPGSLRFDGMAIERSVWQRQGLDEKVITTMLKARKASSAKSYHRVWQSYSKWCEESHFPFLELQLPRILSFLQQGLQLGLKLSSLKVQVSALSILFQSRLANEDLIRTFLQGVAHIMPPFKPPVASWDLNVVLEAMLDPPFEPMHAISDTWITYKVVFLVAISSTRRVSEISALSCVPPYLIFHKDKAVLRTIPEFLPKVVSAFHVNQEIVLPSLCPDPKNDKERRLHNLDVVRALRWYVERSKPFRKSQALFVIPSGPRRGQAASKSTISRWIRESIKQAYSAKGRFPPEGLRAHSTRAVGASWAWRNSASLEQICRAATWSSAHTFSKFYKVDTFSSAEAALGRKVLQSVIS
ncbi:uncharacterized protein LOC121398141 [Xenopus laevis]|uniref:Uncharacterized protein LOC121398141 n=1 Tax=Xenopus laevis TaxID=8355 RepID=A0A8J1LT71_XENLA|nr:uncharacterized protein LOC121398141 [Xenopus laevis]